MTWLISVPAWGERCVDRAIKCTLPSIFASLGWATIPYENVRFVVHSDTPWEFERRWPFGAYGGRLLVRPPPPHTNKYEQLATCHHEAIHEAAPGDVVVCLNADHFCSLEAFHAFRRSIFTEGKLVVVASGTRTAGGDPPPGLRARDLHEWAWSHRHHWVEDCVWGRGKTTMPSGIYFEEGENVVHRYFHPQPVAFVKLSDMDFAGTIDDCLIDNYAREDIHVVTDCDEMALVELSPPEPLFKSDGPLTIGRVVNMANAPVRGRDGTFCTPTHRWLFEHRIIIKGDGTMGETERVICGAIIEQLGR